MDYKLQSDYLKKDQSEFHLFLMQISRTYPPIFKMKRKKHLVSNEMSPKTVFVLLCFSVNCFTKNLPSYIERCSLSDPNISSCLIRSVRNAAPSIAVPFNIPLVEIKVGDNFKMKFANSNFTAFKHMKVENASFNNDTGEFFLKYVDPNMDAICLYEMDINFLGSHIKGNGPVVLNFTDCFITYRTNLKVFTDKKGVEHYGVDGGKLTFKATGATFNFKNLFNGNEALGAATNRLFNENWKDMIGILEPTINNLLPSIMDNVFKTYLKKVPKDAVFLP